MEAAEKDIVIAVRLDEKTFKRFARFDMLTRRKQWVRPALFSLILIAFAVVALLTRKEQSGMIAAVLLAVGLGLPVVYIGTFLSQVNIQAVNNRLNPPRLVYTVRLDKDSLIVENNQKKEETLCLPWRDVQRAFRGKGCIYVYVTPARAFLLPSGQADAPDAAVWDFLCRHMGREKCKG